MISTKKTTDRQTEQKGRSQTENRTLAKQISSANTRLR